MNQLAIQDVYKPYYAGSPFADRKKDEALTARRPARDMEEIELRCRIRRVPRRGERLSVETRTV